MRPTVSDDAQLIAKTLAGNAEAFGELVARHQDRLYNTVLHVVGHVEDARDVVQEAFIQAFLKLNTFRNDSAFFTWLYRIAFNAAITHRRKERPMASVEFMRESARREPVDRNDTPAAAFCRNERCSRIREAIAGLDEEFRAVLVLREIDDCSYETIADILDLPIGTVRSRLHRARLQLRELLAHSLGFELAADKK
jgi:RNA polymerase sigma-70 factor, ECF subfamily